MTLVGHGLIGAAIGAVCIPKTLSREKQRSLFGIFILISMIPDLPLPGWGHHQYHVSHSLFVNLAVMGAGAAWLIASNAMTGAGGLWVLLGGSLVFLIYFLLDSLYRHGLGVGAGSDGICRWLIAAHQGLE